MTDGEIRTIKVIYIAMILGVTFFAGVAIFVATSAVDPKHVTTPEEFNAVNLLAAVALVGAPAGWGIGQILFKRQISSTDETFSVATRIRTAYILRIAIYEGMTFFSLTGLLVAGISGALRQNPSYWLFLIPYGVQILLVKNTFPTRASLPAA